MRVVLALTVWLLAVAAATARPTPIDLAQVGVRARPGAQLPAQTLWQDDRGRALTLSQAEAGRPSVLVFADYRCNSVCGPAFAIAAGALHGSGLAPGRDFNLIVVGLRPAEPVADARAFKAAHLNAAPEVVQRSQMLTGGADAVRALTHAAGYGYAYDPKADQFIHPVAAFVLTPQGRVSRAFPEVAIAGPDLGRALRDARQGRASSLIEIVRVLCHGIDPTTGLYNAPVQTGLRVAAVLTLIALGTGVGLAARRRRAAP